MLNNSLDQLVALGELVTVITPDGRTNYVQTALGAQRARDVWRRTVVSDTQMETLTQRILKES